MKNKGQVALVARARGGSALLALAAELQAQGYIPTVDQAVSTNVGLSDCRRVGIVIDKPHSRTKPVLAVALGGDGCFIQMAVRYAPRGIPLVGVNLGKVGFLADIKHSRMALEIRDVLAGRYIDEQRIMLEIEHRRRNRVIGKQTVINDVVIDRGEVGTLINLDVSIDAKHMFQLRGDGVILSTPGGSTAYNMSAGGPIITPDCACITLTPLNPYSLTHRPLVFNTDRKFSLKVDNQARLVPDGLRWPRLRNGDVIHIHRHRKFMTVRHPKSYSYFSTLREKLYWRHE